MCRPRRCCRRSWIARVVQRTRRRSGSCHTPRQPARTGCRYSRNSRSRSASPAGAPPPPSSQRANSGEAFVLRAGTPGAAAAAARSAHTPPGSQRVTVQGPTGNSFSRYTDNTACCGALLIARHSGGWPARPCARHAPANQHCSDPRPALKKEPFCVSQAQPICSALDMAMGRGRTADGLDLTEPDCRAGT